MAQRAIDVFRYLDYRLFLSDYYRAGKGRGFSYRSFSRAARLRSPNYLKMIIEGQRNLTPEMAERFAAACRLKGEAAEYFVELVRFNQAGSDAERNQAYRRLSAFQRYRQAQRLELAHAAYHANWYVPAIRELIGSPGFREDPAWIGQRLLPPISARRVAHALESLLTLGLVERSEGGQLTQRAAVVSTGAQTASMHIGNYHRTMLKRAAEAIEGVPAARRDITSLTLRVRESSIPQLKSRLARFRRELLELEECESDGDQVLQLNLQLFPLTSAEPSRGSTPAAGGGTSVGDES
jgi:uncharacterized protein (TIGR02147 family)